jgi:hypothetical protein
MNRRTIKVNAGKGVLSAEQEALLRKVFMIRSLPLEEAMTYINAPIFGLTEEVCGLQHTGQGLQVVCGIDLLRLEYLSPRYEQYRYRDDQTFVVTTCLFPKDVHPLFGCRTTMLQVECVVGSSFRMIDGDAVPDRNRSHRLIAKDATFTIDGKNFKGDVTHDTAPVRYSSFTLYHERIGLRGAAAGPSIEELIQILESLHDLNGKEVE